jgi:putative acetyltransferase
MSGPIDFRRYRDSDASEVRALFVRVNRLMAPPNLAHAFEDYIERSLAEEIDAIPAYYGARQGVFFVARAGGKLVGMFGLEAAGEGALELRRMYVAPDARRQGIAHKMLAFAEEEARRMGAHEMVLSTSEIQTEALALYRNAGYRETRVEVADATSNKTIGGGIRRFHFNKTL